MNQGNSVKHKKDRDQEKILKRDIFDDPFEGDSVARLRFYLGVLGPYISDLLTCCYYRLFRIPRTFRFRGKTYRYFYHIYNSTWKNERCIEIPIIWETLKKYRGKNILEVGNCLSHYFQVKHDIVDKFERGRGVINQDIINFKPKRKYDLIVSISTLEHVGYHEVLQDYKKLKYYRVKRDSTKSIRTIERLLSCLNPGGRLIVTMPLGSNPYLDDYLEKGKIRFTKLYCMKRVVRSNVWKEVQWEDIKGIQYGHSIPSALGLIIGIISKS